MSDDHGMADGHQMSGRRQTADRFHQMLTLP